MPIQPGDYQKWAGAGAVALVSDYADNKMKRYLTSLTNGEVVQLGTLAAQIFMKPGKYRLYVDGGADYSVGNLIRRIVGPHITGTTTTPVRTVVTPTSTVTPTASLPGGSSSGLAGVPASAGSAAFDQPTPGF